jgi:hypothetical protein
MNWTLAAPLRNLSGFISTFPGILPESCDPAKSNLFPSSTDLPQPTQRQVFEHEVTRALEIRPSWRLRFSFRTFYRPRFAPHELRLACIQPLSFLSLADSCCTMDARNPFPFYRLRTLSIAMGVYTPLPRALFAKGHCPLRARCCPVAPPTEALLSPFCLCRYGPFLSQRGGYTPPPGNEGQNESQALHGQERDGEVNSPLQERKRRQSWDSMALEISS